MAPGAVALVMGTIGLLLGIGLARWLSTRAYRYDDETDFQVRPVWWVVPVLAAVTAALGWRFADAHPVVLGTYAVAAATFAALAAIDADVHRLPDKITLPAYPVFAGLLALCSWAVGDWGAWVEAMLTGLALLFFYFLLALFAPGGGLGLGDVKLAGSIGMLTGWFGWPLAFVATFLAFVLGGLIGVVLLVGRRAGLKSQIAFGPPMMAAALLALIVPPSVWAGAVG